MEPDTFQLFGRFDGPLNLRLILQPCIAAIFGYLDGTKDARDGAPPYFWSGDQCFTTGTPGADQAWLWEHRKGVHPCLYIRLRLPVCRLQIDFHPARFHHRVTPGNPAIPVFPWTDQSDQKQGMSQKHSADQM
jgi:hypothetical protein